MSAAERRRVGVIEGRNGRGVPTQGGSVWVRLVGAVGMAALTLALWWLLTDAGFRVDAGAIRVTGVHRAEGARVEELLSDLTRAPNVFRVRPREVERGLMTLPQVRSVRATVHLPAEARVQVIERQPIFVWSNGGDAWLVDREGVLFARPGSEDMPTTLATGATADEADDPSARDDPSAPEDASAPADAAATDDASAPADAAAPEDASAPDDEDPVSTALAPRGLPMVEDGRIVAQAPGLGDRLGELDLAVLRQLLALTPEMLGSASSSLRLRVDELDGYVLESLDPPWQAVFGRYSPTLHRPDLIPRQVQCLAALLSDRESRLTRVWLVTSGSVCGTHLRIAPAG